MKPGAIAGRSNSQTSATQNGNVTRLVYRHLSMERNFQKIDRIPRGPGDTRLPYGERSHCNADIHSVGFAIEVVT